MVFSGVLSSDSMLSCVLVQKLVVKPDQLIKRRGKLGLVGINLDLPGVLTNHPFCRPGLVYTFL